MTDPTALPALPAEMAAAPLPPGSAHCAACAYFRAPVVITPFSAADLSSAAGLKAQVEWEQEQKGRNQNEYQRILAGQRFPYKPMFYPWCAKVEASDAVVAAAEAGDSAARASLAADGSGLLDPVSGKVAKQYVACATRNPQENCSDFTPSA